jgi:hypothetical protein
METNDITTSEFDVMTRTCKICGKQQEIKIRHGDWERYMDGDGSFKKIFPYLTKADREIIFSGICGNCWANMIM